MRIAGLQKLSLVDFPGNIASTVFVQGCNFKCGFCHNPDLIDKGRSATCDVHHTINEIIKNRNMIDGVVITGGEPTIYKDISDFARLLKNEGFKIKLDTNGSCPDTLKTILDRKDLLDYIAMDFKTSYSKYHFLTGIQNIGELLDRSLDLIMSSGVDYEFRTTCVPELVDRGDIDFIGNKLKGAEKIALQQFRPYVTLDSSFKDKAPYDKDLIYGFRDILAKYVGSVELRGI